MNALDLKLILNALKLKLKSLKTCFLKKVKDNSQSPSWIPIMDFMIKHLPKIVCNRTSCKRYYNLDLRQLKSRKTCQSPNRIRPQVKTTKIFHKNCQ